MKNKSQIRAMVLTGLLMAIVVIFCTTPIGSIPVGPLVITLNVIPIGIAAVALGPVGGLIIGTFFGILSFLQCFGIGVPSAMGAVLLEINPFFAFIQRVIPRALDGLIAGFIFRGVAKTVNSWFSCFLTGFCAALFNTVLFMGALVLLFGNTDYVQELMAGKNVIMFIITFVGVNALVEMCTASIFTGAVGSALVAAKLVNMPEKKHKSQEIAA
ncbi:MAG: ECF transporter S component [Ruminococcus sp.]|nr:ECF transporter S component [Ruminococcus sp.]